MSEVAPQGTLAPLRIAVIGAGAAGLCTAKVLIQAGHEVTVFDRTPDVGGVWSRTRRYPGVQTQSPRDTYAFTDYPMPSSYPEWPNGEQVQHYFAAYAAEFGVDRHCRLNTSVESARPNRDGGWVLAVTDALTGASSAESFDKLVVANGVFCEPQVPEYVGLEEFTAAGGRLSPATEFHDVAEARGKNAIVIGYGKSACDVAVALSEVTASTSVIARQMLWKVPRKIGGVVNFKFLLLTRMGEALFRFAYLRGMEKFLHGPGNAIRRNMINSVGSASVRQYKLDRLGLLPAGTMEDIVRGAIGLATEGFYDNVAKGSIVVHRDRTVIRLLAVDGVPSAELSDGTVLPADLIICATGFKQGVPFLDPQVQAKLFDERANFMLYRQLLPAGGCRSVLRRLQLVLLQPVERGDRCPLDRRAPGRAGSGARARGDANRDRATTGVPGRRDERTPLPRHQDHPVLDAQRRRTAGRPGVEHQSRRRGRCTGWRPSIPAPIGTSRRRCSARASAAGLREVHSSSYSS